MRIPPRMLIAGLVITGLCAAAPARVAAAQHAFGPFQIHVGADEAGLAAQPDYQIIVENEELLLSRLTAGYEGRLSNSFVADLDRDGAFEVIVTFSYDNGHQTGIHLYSWHEDRLQPHKVAALDGAQADGYRGNDTFAVTDGELVRIYQVYKQTDGGWEPTAEQRRLRYSLRDARWLGN